VPVDDRDAPEALRRQPVEQVPEHLDVRRDPQAHAAGEGGEVGSHPEGERREHRDADRLRGLDRYPLGEDRVRPQGEVAVLLG